jgi:hypothetical protein
MLIWQEFKAIVSDAWAVVASWGAVVLRGFQELLKDAAENYQRVIVVGIGAPTSLFLVGVPFLALMESMADWIRASFGAPPTPRIFEGGFIGFLLMFGLGLVTITLTVELDDRIMKRLAGKPKDDAQATTPESEVGNEHD